MFKSASIKPFHVFCGQKEVKVINDFSYGYGQLRCVCVCVCECESTGWFKYN